MGDKEQKDNWGNQGNQGWGNQGNQGQQGWGNQGQQGWGNNQQGQQGWGNQGQQQQWGNQGQQGQQWGNQGQQQWGNQQQGQNWGNQGNQGQNWGNNQGNFNNIGVSGFEHFNGGGFGQYGASYAIRSAYGRVLDINQAQSNSSNVGDAIIYDFNGTKNQRFTIANDGQDLIIRSVQDDRVVEAIPGGPNTKGTVRAGPFNGTPNERWRIRKVDNSNNLYFLVNVADGKCLDVEGEKSGNGTNVITWTYNGKKNQMWQIIPVAPGVKSLPGSNAFSNIGQGIKNVFNGGNW